MKNTTSLILALLAIVLIVSCKKEQPVYSCNPQLNKWAIKNQARFSELGRDDLADINSLDTMLVTYQALSPESKYDVWVEKFNLVLSTLTLSDADRTHIENLIENLDESIWESTESLDEFAEGYADTWEKYARETLRWDDEKIYLIAETYLMPNEVERLGTRYLENEKVERPNGATPAEPGCECRKSIACRWFEQKCAHGGCESTYNCGIASTSRCKGLCVDNTSIQVNPTTGQEELIPNSPTYIH